MSYSGTVIVPKGSRLPTVCRLVLQAHGFSTEKMLFASYSPSGLVFRNDEHYFILTFTTKIGKHNTTYKYELTASKKKLIRFSELFPNENVYDVIQMVRKLHRQSQPDYEPGEVLGEVA